MRKLLLFFALLTVSIGTWAATISGDGISGATDNSSGKKVQTLVVSTPGALAAWVAAHTGNYDTNNPFGGLGGSDDFYSLKISGTLSAEDFAALNSTTCAAFSRFPRIDMSEVTLASGATSKDVCNVVFGPASFDKNGVQQNGTGATFIVLPNGVTSADDVTLMAGMKGKGNSALKVVGAYDGTNQDLPEIALYSFAENQLSNFSSEMMNLDGKAMVARLAGTYGNKDLVNSGPVFGWTPPCIWDFTGATFTSCTLNPGVKEYHAITDPFCDGPTSKPGDDFQTNAFFYFSNYSTRVVDIKLPTEITSLPPHSLNDLGAQNLENDKHKAAYKAYYHATDDDLAGDLKVPGKTAAIIPTLTIPNNYVTLDFECATSAHIRHLVVGSGIKYVQGGAFYSCLELEDLDFAAGISDCYLGEDAFRGQQNSVMKHIALSEGIVSLGANCFKNAQNLESIRLPQTLINIGNNAFDNCLALNSITIPENVDKIGMDAFKLCPFTDIFLTTTDPNKIPFVFTGGNDFNNWGAGASFHHGHYDGWEGMSGVHAGSAPDGYTWDEAVEWYFVHVNGLPVLHYPKELADKVRADISANYHGHSSDTPSIGLPTAADMHARETAGGANVGTSGSGIYTRDGWAQFMLMKEFSTGPGSEVYQKEYDDVWYTMCFPFDLTDEQLAAAFNETFNIVDFSGVEVVEKEQNDGESMKLILHFNNVAVTDYKDNAGNHYERKKDTTGNIIREKDATSGFEYNVYTKKGDTSGVEYHHVNVSSFLSSNKTKTFRPSNSTSNDDVVIIDGVLATAGHPYMIHPAIGVVAGKPKQRCTFAGIEWKGMTTWDELFKKGCRSIDLGTPKTADIVELRDSNYTHPGYEGYAGQTYTFIGNPNDYITEGAPEAPTIANGRLHDYPTKPTKEAYPTEPTKAAYPEEPTKRQAPTAPTSTEITEEPTFVENPSDDTSTYPESFQSLFNAVRCTQVVSYNPYTTKDITYGEDIAAYNMEEFFEYHNYGNVGYYYKTGYNQTHGADLSSDGLNAFKSYLGGEPVSTDAFNSLKAKVNSYASAKSDYDVYATNLAIYNEWKDYHAAYADWEANAESEYQTAHSQWESDCEDIDNAYTTAHSQWESDCADIDDAYDTAYTQWQSDCADVDTYNDGVYAAWEIEVAAYKRQIPEHAYFLGRKAGQLPKYYREVAAEEYPAPSSRTGGFWPQFTAVVIPNTAAINGIEKGITKKQAGSKGFDMLFNEDFEGTFIDQDEATTLIEKAQAEGAEVKHIDIVVNINGQVVRRGTTSIEGLPKGIYIINGKKYFVK